MRKNDLQIEGQMNIFDFLTDESPPETNYDNSHTKEEAVQQSDFEDMTLEKAVEEITKVLNLKFKSVSWMEDDGKPLCFESKPQKGYEINLGFGKFSAGKFEGAKFLGVDCGKTFGDYHGTGSPCLTVKEAIDSIIDYFKGEGIEIKLKQMQQPIKTEAVQQSKEFPKIPSTDEIPSKSWHYAAMEQPKKEDIYYIAKYLNNDNDYFSYVYAAYFKGTWWHWNHWEKKWQAYRENEFSRSYRPESIIAWVGIPSEFNNDPHLNEIRGLKGIVR